MPHIMEFLRDCQRKLSYVLVVISNRRNTTAEAMELQVDEVTDTKVTFKPGINPVATGYPVEDSTWIREFDLLDIRFAGTRGVIHGPAIRLQPGVMPHHPLRK